MQTSILTDFDKQTDLNIHLNLPPNKLHQLAIERKEGILSKEGALVVKTGKHTGRSANDKYIVKDETSSDKIWWENTLSPMSPENFAKLKKDTLEYLRKQPDVFVTDRSVGAHDDHYLNLRLFSTHAAHSVFASYMFRDSQGLWSNDDFTILHAPLFEIDPKKYDVKNPTVISTCFKTKTTIIIGSLYAGEIKKSMFCVLNYFLPEKKILPMHSGCNRNESGEVSIFFGLSGTGKTTLSTDEGMLLIGDDEHGLGDDGVFNFEGGCYAKTYKLAQETEPEIYEASTCEGSFLENVVLKADNSVDFFDKSITENGRSSYPLSFIKEIEPTSKGKIPSQIFFLTADAFGVLPPVAKLDKQTAMDYFVLGYTSKLAGTEIGVLEPQTTFSACFGAPFMMRNPNVYAELLGHYLDKYDIPVWLINTGWTGGPYGQGQRFPLAVTRQIIRQVQAHKLNTVEFIQEPFFGLQIPKNIDGVDSRLLNPKESWKHPENYDEKARYLAKSFEQKLNSLK